MADTLRIHPGWRGVGYDHGGGGAGEGAGLHQKGFVFLGLPRDFNDAVVIWVVKYNLVITRIHNFLFLEVILLVLMF